MEFAGPIILTIVVLILLLLMLGEGKSLIECFLFLLIFIPPFTFIFMILGSIAVGKHRHEEAKEWEETEKALEEWSALNDVAINDNNLNNSQTS